MTYCQTLMPRRRQSPLSLSTRRRLLKWLRLIGVLPRKSKLSVGAYEMRVRVEDQIRQELQAGCGVDRQNIESIPLRSRLQKNFPDPDRRIIEARVDGRWVGLTWVERMKGIACGEITS